MERLAAIKAFARVTLNHSNLELAIKRLGLAVNQADRGSMVFMFGPTGVGKSTLVSHMCAKLDKELRQQGGYDDSTLPAVVIEAPYSDAREFSWKEFYIRALKRLHDPLPGKKIDDPRCSAIFGILNEHRQTGHALRMAFENALEYRKVRVLVIDEAHHVAKGASRNGLKEQLEYIKSLANLTEKIIVLVGTYELLSFRNLSGQLSRRSLDVHFRRYNLNNRADYQVFCRIVKSFASKLPIPCDFELGKMVEDLYVGSLGCVGILSGWLARAMTLAVEEGNGMLRKQDLLQSMSSHDQMSKMIDELLEGEQLLTPPQNSFSTLKARLGVTLDLTTDLETQPKTAKKTKPFKRKPVRDPVGTPA